MIAQSDYVEMTAIAEKIIVDFMKVSRDTLLDDVADRCISRAVGAYFCWRQMVFSRLIGSLAFEHFDCTGDDARLSALVGLPL